MSYISFSKDLHRITTNFYCVLHKRGLIYIHLYFVFIGNYYSRRDKGVIKV